ncbi:ABC transporter ATP-binding protein [Cellulomonas chengniuliangii]|uniref:ABC transporter ATP-binding protein/permease n=1 Tax=Cellulomonas chengniuliangii TaxID=2968084 RepID=A0ABY5L529_9CELL|nr:ABC transporter ATP-binding protein [Cellulomonas chengniuliangii]MCC2308319.1 ABC transporter ATP-binding protein/permease [Cellulomonas chengniuliangii]MCC2317326.1 ABC transporter ATP-binding protein/permease [Cellulomonas chengniuliangii]UUI76702.1 ABC transporter ATP-binding protein/permease [Cellulomonas chengniuliangii]
MRSIIRVLSSTQELWRHYVGIILCSVAVTATGLLTPFIIKAATDYVVAATQGEASGVATVVWLAAALLAADLANTLLSNIGGYLGDTMAARLRATLSARYFAKLLSLPQRYFDDELTGAVINRLSRSITEVTGFLNMFANSFFQMLLTVVAVLAVTGFYSLPMALLLAAIYPIFMWLTTKTSTRWQALETQKNRELDIAGGRFAEVIAQIRVVKSFVQERRELAAFTRRYDSTVETTQTQSRYWHGMDAARRAALNVLFFGIFAILFVQTARGEFTIGVMVLLIQLVTMARQPVFSMSYMVDSAQRAVAGSRDYFRAMDELSEAETLPALPAEGPGRRRGPAGIELEQVSFGYAGGADVLHDLTFSILPGEHIAFVGESGGGKTTLVSLLMRLYEPSSGAIRIDGADITALPLEELRSGIGVVFQDPSLFSGTIRENIAYGSPEATDEDVAAAARSANAHEFVSRLPLGYDSPIGERGVKLSGGQKQRIAVARAMLKDAPVLVLDEATSSLDSRSERLVQEGLERLMADRTTLIIAHRLSTISAVDRIVTLKDGRVDEIGTPDELAASGGIYAQLLALQASSSTRDRKRLRQFDIRA